MPVNEQMWMATLNNPEDRFECARLLESIEGISGVIVGLQTLYFRWSSSPTSLWMLVDEHPEEKKLCFLDNMRRTGDAYAKTEKV